MDSSTLVKERVEDGQRLIDRLHAEGVPVTLSFWNKPDEERRWVFCVVSPQVDGDISRTAYRRILDVVRTLGPDFLIGPFDLQIMGERDPLAAEMIEAMKLAPARFSPDAPPLAVEGRRLWVRYPQRILFTSATPVLIPGV